MKLILSLTPYNFVIIELCAFIVSKVKVYSFTRIVYLCRANFFFHYCNMSRVKVENISRYKIYFVIEQQNGCLPLFPILLFLGLKMQWYQLSFYSCSLTKLGIKQCASIITPLKNKFVKNKESIATKVLFIFLLMKDYVITGAMISFMMLNAKLCHANLITT